MALPSQITQSLSFNPNSLMRCRPKISSLLMISGLVELTPPLRKSCHSITTITQNIMMKTISCSRKSLRCQRTRHPQAAITVWEQWHSICRLWRMLSIVHHRLIISPSLLRHLQYQVWTHSLKERSSQPSISLRKHRLGLVQLTELPHRIEKIAVHQLLRYKNQFQGKCHRSLLLEVLPN